MRTPRPSPVSRSPAKTSSARSDNLTRAQRSFCMSRVKSTGTSLELAVSAELKKKGLAFRTHVRELIGTPDIVFVSARVVVFVDGDFWHGYRLPEWHDNLSPFWQRKISSNRARDKRTFRALRRRGWTVIRIWQHQIKSDMPKCIKRITAAVRLNRRGAIKSNSSMRRA